MTNPLELIQELKKFLSANRHCLTGEEIELLNQVIEELRKADESSHDSSQFYTNLVRTCELVLKLFDMN